MKDYKPQDISALKKKSKDKTTKFSMLGNKRKKKMEKSEKQKVLDIVLKHRDLSMEGVEQIAKQQKYDITRDEIKFIQGVYTSRVDLRSISLAKNLIINPIVIYDVLPFVTPILTNDYLYWCYHAYKKANDMGISDFASMKGLYIVSDGALVYDNDVNFYEFYSEDYNPSVSCPTWCDTVATIGDGATEVANQSSTFYIDKSEYIRSVVSVTKNKTDHEIFREKTIDLKTSLDLLSKQIILNDRRNLSKGMKVLSKEAGGYYFQLPITPTTFCVSTLVFPNWKTMGTKVLFEYNVDPELFIKTLVNNAESAGKYIKILISLLSWDSLLSMMELIAVIFITYPKAKAVLKDIYDAYPYYIKNRRIIEIYKKHYLLYEKVVLSFLDSFTTGISIDRMTKVLNAANEYINQDDLLIREVGTKDIIVEFIEYFDIGLLKNFLSDSTRSNVLMIKRVCELILSPSEDSANIVMEVRALGTILMDVLYTGSNRVLTKIRSPAAFLSNITGEFKYDTLMEYITSIKRKLNDNAVKEDEKKKTTIQTKKILAKEIIDSLQKMDTSNPQLQNLLTTLSGKLEQNLDEEMKQLNENRQSRQQRTRQQQQQQQQQQPQSQQYTGVQTRSQAAKAQQGTG